jgi:hypothetical protein
MRALLQHLSVLEVALGRILTVNFGHAQGLSSEGGKVVNEARTS